ncbi:MAG: hypothetical protein ACOY3D_06100 [Candidatus Omnitrophota bacterium]
MYRLTRLKKEYILEWVILLVAVEFLIFILPRYQALFLVLVAAGFFAAFLLRIFQAYPGRREPLVLDIASCSLALLLCAIATALKPHNSLILIFLPVIAVPHILYIVNTHRF